MFVIASKDLMSGETALLVDQSEDGERHVVLFNTMRQAQKLLEEFANGVVLDGVLTQIVQVPGTCEDESCFDARRFLDEHGKWCLH